MDHDTAKRTQATERYVLDEMDAQESAAFEAHYFECSECAEDVKAADRFAVNARAYFARPRPAADPARERRESAGWFGWLRPAWISPALAGLFAVVAGYSWLVTIPRLRVERSANTVEVFRPVLLRAEVRGGELPVIHVRPGAPAVVTLNVESEREYPGYHLEILNASGSVVSSIDAAAGPTITLKLPPALLGGGAQTIVVRGGANGRPEIGRYRFEIVNDPE